jgi:hypothetical protein
MGRIKRKGNSTPHNNSLENSVEKKKMNTQFLTPTEQ